MILRNMWFWEMILEFGHNKTKSRKLVWFINSRDFQFSLNLNIGINNKDIFGTI